MPSPSSIIIIIIIIIIIYHHPSSIPVTIPLHISFPSHFYDIVFDGM